MAETPSSTQHSGIALFSAGATAIEALWGAVCGMAMSGWVFFIWTVGRGFGSASGMRAKRAVSFLGPDESAPAAGVTGTGAWAAGDGFVESSEGGGGGGKTSGEVRT